MIRSTEYPGAPAVSIVLPTFNRLKFLRKAVDSIFEQSFLDWELIIADDGSDSETAAFLATLVNPPRVRLLRLQHTGNPSAARNAALREARGKYIAFLDSDDLWLPQKLERQLRAMAADPVRRWCYTALSRVDADGNLLPSEAARRRVLHGGAVLEKLLTLEIAVATPCVIAERALIQQAGGFDEEQKYFEEYDLWQRLSLISDVIALEEPLALVRNHQEHYSNDRVGVCIARLRLLNKLPLPESETYHMILRLERAKTAASLAAAYANNGQLRDTFKMLWRSRECAWQGRQWWRQSALSIARVVAPSWLREFVRRHRGRLHPAASSQV